MITEKTPATWQELQEWCAQILRECGWQSETDVTVQTARGRVKIDVLAIETVEGRQYKTLIECKNWSRRIPQTEIHSFNTVVAAVDANAGFLVSRVGFQSGAYKAAEYTNVTLLTWQEFQDIFETQWYWKYLRQFVVNTLDPLTDYLQPIPAMVHWDHYLEDREKDRVKRLYSTHQPLCALGIVLSPFLRELQGDSAKIDLPLINNEHTYTFLPEHLRSRTGYREFFEELEKFCLPILREFEEIRELALSRRDSSKTIGM